LLIDLARETSNNRRFDVGSRLRYADGRIAALATVRDGLVVLHPGSSVYLQTSMSVGQRSRLTHASFLEAARVVRNSNIGITLVAIAGRIPSCLRFDLDRDRSRSAFCTEVDRSCGSVHDCEHLRVRRGEIGQANWGCLSAAASNLHDWTDYQFGASDAI
jgi:hypothetical protein